MPRPACRAQGQGVVYGESQEGKPREGGYIARESLSSGAARSGAGESEVYITDLSNPSAPSVYSPGAKAKMGSPSGGRIDPVHAPRGPSRGPSSRSCGHSVGRLDLASATSNRHVNRPSSGPIRRSCGHTVGSVGSATAQGRLGGTQPT